MKIQNLFKILLSLFVIICITGISKLHAQVEDNHFIYIQAENRKPFYVILNDKLYSSSSIGYLIIPKLKSGTYGITVGFPQNAAPEQKFVSVVKNQDIGYSLKAVDNNTYTLTDLQTQEVLASGKGTAKATQSSVTTQSTSPAKTEDAPVKAREETVFNEPVNEPVVEETKTAPIQEKPVVEQPVTSTKVEEAAASTPAPVESEKKNRSFGELMSDVTNDPSLSKKEEPKTPPTPQRDPFDRKIIRTGDAQKEEVKTNTPIAQPVVVTEEVKTTQRPVAPIQSDTYGVIRTENKRVSEGQEMSFVLLGDRSTDSVKIIIPVKEEPVATPPVETKDNNNNNTNAESARKSIAYFDYEDLASSTPSTPRAAREPRNNASRRSKASSKEKNISSTSVSPETTTSTDEVKTVERTPVRNNNIASSNNCNAGSLADKDFNKLRNKMIGRDNEDDMISTALDMIGDKCIDTEKVKTLSGLFITDTGRMKFYDAIYKKVSDKQNFASLEDQIYDRGKKAQFRRLINQ